MYFCSKFGWGLPSNNISALRETNTNKNRRMNGIRVNLKQKRDNESVEQNRLGT